MTGSEFKGSNMVITGEDNVLESNLFIGGEAKGQVVFFLGGVFLIPKLKKIFNINKSIRILNRI